MANPDDGAREQQRQRPAPERAPAQAPAVEPAPTVVPTVDARGTGTGMRETLEGMDAVSRHRMVSDMQRRSGNVAVQQALGQEAAGAGGPVVASTAAKPSTSARDEHGGERHDANQALLGSLVEHGSLGGSGATAQPGGPVASAGSGSEAPPASPPAPPPPPRFRPAGVAGDTEPEDLTALPAAELQAWLDRLWRDGVLLGDADALAPLVARVATLERGGELRAFALLAAVAERVATSALWQPLEATGEPAVDALWLAAGLWRSALVAGVEPVAPATLGAAVEATLAAGDPRVTAIVAWAGLAEAELALAQGESERGAALTGAVADDPNAPAGAVIAAGLRSGLLEAFVQPTRALARLAAAGARALATRAEADRVHVLVRRVLLELIAGDGEAARIMLASAPGAADAPLEVDGALADLLRTLAGGGADAARRWVTEPTVERARGLAAQGAADGDYLLACGIPLACARAQRHADPEGALSTIFGGVALLAQAFGPGTAGPLEDERAAVAAALGPERFNAAMRAAVERSERALRPRTGPAAPPG